MQETILLLEDFVKNNLFSYLPRYPQPVVGTVTEETNDYFATRYWALKKSN
jgi:hypothetical protein